METVARDLDAYKDRKGELCARYAGQYAVFLGGDLLTVQPSLEDALSATAIRFDEGALPAGVPILICEISESPGLQVVTELRHS